MNEPLHIDKGDVYLYLAAIDSASHPDRRVAVAVVFVWTGTGLRCDVHCVEVISSMLHPHVFLLTRSCILGENMAECPQEMDGQDFSPDDRRNPRAWSVRKKSLISIVCAVSYFVVLFANANYISSIYGVKADFHVSDTLAILPITLYSFGFALGPTFGTAFSEILGRQYFYKTLLALSLVFTVVAGSARNYATLAVGRALAGTLASPCVGIFAGMLNDLWDHSAEPLGSQFVVIYAMFGAFAPLVGPISGSAVVSVTDDWRWTFWLTALLLGGCVVINLPVPETFAPRIFREPDSSSSLSSMTLPAALRVGLGRPLHMLLVEPIMLPTAAYGAVVQGILFAWTANSSIHWTVPVMSGVLFGCSFPLNLLGFPWYKNDIYGAKYGASAVAVENLLRYLFSSFVPLFTVHMIQHLSFRWTMSFWGVVSLALMPVPWVMYRWGPWLRVRSRGEDLTGSGTDSHRLLNWLL
ncbi:MFS multidrug transporter [Rasamsonia emersonii CBS 393.64]|uniref:MFS multidrug transporter n=1 Tax=Rasamsonia emersonii (strain ATCC 16479 / CBS 393.64 / IMI 116815) TaxID=1408163 RepID=A0A0F4YP77_RASE3|nr:MFS multidrug transporter [Rasamsonia emersonii CBS 393.64]KKA20077.1 MFS multidrug transporter [Rasamsonia emersonii CBS 393.64]